MGGGANISQGPWPGVQEWVGFLQAGCAVAMQSLKPSCQLCPEVVPGDRLAKPTSGPGLGPLAWAALGEAEGGAWEAEEVRSPREESPAS